MRRVFVCIFSLLLAFVTTSYPLYALEEENVDQTDEIEEVEEAGEIEEVEEVEQEESEEEIEEIIFEKPMDAPLYDGILRYVYVGLSQLEIGQAQKVVVALTDTVDLIQLVVSSPSQTYTFDCTNQVDTLYEFDLNFEEATKYQIQSIQYEKEGNSFEYDLNSMDICFEVNEKVDAYVASISSDEQQEAIDSIQNALTNASPDVQSPTLFTKVADSFFTDVQAGRDLIITLDPGHGNYDSGAVGVNGSYEKYLNLQIATYLKSYLEQYQNVKVYMTRYDDSICPDLYERCKMAHDYQSDVMISVHLNSSGSGAGYGAEVYYPNTNYLPMLQSEGSTLAQNIENQLIALGIRERGVYIRNIGDASSSYSYSDGSDGDYYGIIRHSKSFGIPAIIIEHCFIDNVSDYNNYLSSDDRLQSLARSDCAGIVQAYHLALKNKTDDAMEGYTISLDGSIGVNFYMALCQETIDDKNAYVLLTLPNSNSYTQKRIYVKNVQTKTINNKNYYVFPCDVSTKEMTKEIKAKLVTSKYTGKEYTFTVNGYANYIIEHEKEYSNKIVEIAKTLKEYGKATQIYFNYNTNALPSSNTTIPSYDFSSFQKQIVKEDKNIQFKGARLLLKSNIGLKLYFEGGDTFYVNGNKVQAIKDGNYTVITIANINYMNLDKMYSITSNQFEMKYGFLSYGYDASKTNNTDLKNIVNSLYHFYQALHGTGTTYLPNENYEMVFYTSHHANDGWLQEVSDGQTAGSQTNGLRMEAIRMKLGKGVSYEGGIEYRTSIQNRGWESAYKKDGEVSGLSGHSLYIEAIQIRLHGKVADHFDVYYRVYSKKYGWLDWQKNGQTAGTTGQSQQIEAIQVKLEKKGNPVPTNSTTETVKEATVQATPQTGKDGMYYVMGSSHVTVTQMVNYYHRYRFDYDVFANASYNGIYAKGGASTIEEFCQIYYEEAKAEGVNVEVAFTQAMLETGFLKFGGDVAPNQYNFAGMGATGGVPGNSFTSVRQGIRAQIQHLKCYGSTEALKNENVDPRWWEALRGTGEYVEYLAIPNNPYGRGWAGDANYGTKLRSMISELSKA